MHIADSIILAGAVFLVVFTVIYNLRKKKQRTSGCTSNFCGAGSCSGCTMHRSVKQDKDDKSI